MAVLTLHRYAARSLCGDCVRVANDSPIVFEDEPRPLDNDSRDALRHLIGRRSGLLERHRAPVAIRCVNRCDRAGIVNSGQSNIRHASRA